MHPTDDPEWVRQEGGEKTRAARVETFRHLRRCARLFTGGNTELPAGAPVAVAHEECWTITLHMQRTLSAADPSNQYWIRYYCEKYPHMTLILDHAARGFNPYLALKGIPELTGLDNLYVDTSVCCAPLAIMACLQYLGVDHVMYASDFFCSTSEVQTWE